MQYHLIEDWMTIKIGRGVENRITVNFPYDPDYIAKIKTMQGYRWHPEEKYWSLPLDNSILDKLASLFEGERLETEIYTHVSKKDLSRIQSPLDLIMKKEVRND